MINIGIYPYCQLHIADFSNLTDEKQTQTTTVLV